MATESVPEEVDIGNCGERVTVTNHGAYWAHLSIYRFALPYIADRRVLDAGSGEGYGAAYLARHGARGVLALEASADAVAHARRRYAGDCVTYERADLNEKLPVGDRTFDVIFSSNVFEHVADVDALTSECARAVTQGGVVIVAVPPVTCAAAFEGDLRNHFHVHHIPPTAWRAKLGRFFADIRCYAHLGTGMFADNDRLQQEMTQPPEKVIIRETDFAFPEATAEALETSLLTNTAVFVCRDPRPDPGPETLAERTPAAWHESTAAARLIAEERSNAAVLRAELAAARAQADDACAQAATLAARAAALESSTFWRLTSPARALVTALRGGSRPARPRPA